MKNYKELIAENLDWAKGMIGKIDEKMSKVTLRSRDKLPDGVDENGIHVDKKETAPTWWVNGFWGGLNWLLYNYTGNEEYKKTAERSEQLLDAGLMKNTVIHHDVGFMWHLTSGASYRLTGSQSSKTRSLFAASTLFSRFILDGGFIRAWNTKGSENWTIIDSMMNLPILYWASDVLGDDRFKRIAMAHADITIDTHLRPDGSVAHIVEHDRETGELLKTYAGQGVREGSSWSRGQAWAVYGFTLSYLHTGEERYLNAAKQVANYFIANCCDDWLPRVDFRAPSEPVYYDSTAGSCAACGMLELAKLLPEDEGGMYANAAINMLKAMGEKFMNFDPKTDDMLGYGTVRFPTPDKDFEKCGVHVSIMYGDFFYTEAILKLLGSEFNPWLK